MSNIEYRLLQPRDAHDIDCVAAWYLDEWKIPPQFTHEKLAGFPARGVPFHVLLTIDDEPVATGGVHDHVGILDREPRLRIHPYWLALMFTTPAHRGRGLGALLCDFIEEQSRQRGLARLHLFTHTAERLYERQGWIVDERLSLGGRDIAVMSKTL